ncbi:hypothetical protein FDUTEX481_00116 [Tolypothrix sp. PCC 7601]|nr:hypothetical protein FDUTEX481_00116 [Tolypothrix sp. PCC 7601]
MSIGHGAWGMGHGALVIGVWCWVFVISPHFPYPQSPVPSPQSPIPNLLPK